MTERARSRSKDTPGKRRPYESPRLARVDLVADEILALGCKTPGWGGSIPGVSYSCIVSSCSQLGS